MKRDHQALSREQLYVSGQSFRKSLRRSSAVVALGLCSIALASSCGQSKLAPIKGQQPVFPVSGQLMMGGEPMTDAQVFFIPIDEPAANVSRIRPHAVVDEDGAFKVSTYGSEDGAPAGNYRVVISWRGALAGGAGDSDDRPEKVPAAYRNPRTSRLKVEIAEGENALPTWEIPPLQQHASNNPR
jgi:hypothetical protein